MDVVCGFLDGPRARQAFVLRAILEPPWSLRVQDEAPLTLITMVRDAAWVMFDDGERARLDPGDVALFRGPDHYVVADDPATDPQVVIHPGDDCRDLDGNSLAEAMRLGVRTWGSSATGSSVMLVGTYHTDGELSGRLLGALPRLAIIRAGAWEHSPLLSVLATEVGRDAPGQQAVLDRLLDLVLVAALRAWFAGRTPTRRTGSAPMPTPSPGRPCACCTATRRGRGRSPRWPPPCTCRGRRWPGGSTTSSANRR